MFKFLSCVCCYFLLACAFSPLMAKDKVESLRGNVNISADLKNVDLLGSNVFGHYDYYSISQIHKLAYYCPYAIYNGGQTIELFDYSCWYVNPFSRNTVRGWTQSDSIFIRPNSAWFSSYQYELYNLSTNEVVEVDFSSMYRDYQRFTQRIVKIDYFQRWVQLDDVEGTVWQISFSETGFDNWRVGDYLIVGVNKDWNFSYYPHILINVDCGVTYCEALFYGYSLY